MIFSYLPCLGKVLRDRPCRITSRNTTLILLYTRRNPTFFLLAEGLRRVAIRLADEMNYDI